MAAWLILGVAALVGLAVAAGAVACAAALASRWGERSRAWCAGAALAIVALSACATAGLLLVATAIVLGVDDAAIASR